MYNKKTTRILFSLLALLQIFTLGVTPALASLGDISPQKLAKILDKMLGKQMGENLAESMSALMADLMSDEMEEKYNIDGNAIREQAQSFNVMQNKSYAPQMMLNFSPEKPTPNEELTASAVPIYFGNDAKKMYFTWYIKHAGCNQGDDIDDENEFCDSDDDGEITVNDWKVTAARKIAGNDFNWIGAREDGAYNHNTDGIYPPSATEQRRGEDSRGDGYIAYFGGDDQIGLTKTLDDPSDTLEDFICRILNLTYDPEADSAEEERRAEIYAEFDCSDSSFSDQTATEEELADACVEDRECIETLDENASLLASLDEQAWADGCRNSATVCSDSALGDSILGCVEDTGATTTPNPEAECYAASTLEPGQATLMTPASLASACENDTSNDDTYSCATTALLIENHGLNYENLFNVACTTEGEEDCALLASLSGGDYEGACFQDGTCLLTALSFVLSDAQLADACENTPSCEAAAVGNANTEERLVALLEFADDIENGADYIEAFLEEYPEFAADLEYIKEQIQDAAEETDLEELLEKIIDILGDIEDQAGSLFDLTQKNAHCYVRDFTSGLDYEIGTSCSGNLHTFPRDDDGELPGKGEFRREDELFWHTNPADVSTADNGNVDEANVIGLGQDTFTWTYQPGDQIGLVIEGISFEPTKYANASNKIMWALSKNVFDEGDCGIKKDGVITKTIKGYKVRIPKAKFDGEDEYGNLRLDKCLEANLVDPLSGGQAEKIVIDLDYSPQNPVNNSSGDEDMVSNQLEVQASITSGNITDQSLANYTWTVQASSASSAITDDWETVRKSTLKKVSEQTSGKGLDTFKMDLKITKDDLDLDGNEEINFLKVSVNIKENIYGDINHEGNKSIIIPLFSTSEQIFVYPVEVTNADPADPTSISELSLLEDGYDATEGCLIGDCLAIKNDLIGLKFQNPDNDYSNFSWIIDGEPFLPLSGCLRDGTCSFDEDGISSFGANTNIAYFPITKDPGEQHTVVLNADGLNGKKINITKLFTVVEPSIKLFAKDNSGEAISRFTNPSVRGRHIAPDQTSFLDLDYGVFETIQNNPIKISAVPNFRLDSTNTRDFTWTIGNFITIEIDKYGITTLNGEGIPTDTAGNWELTEAQNELLISNGIEDLEIIESTTEKSISFIPTKEDGTSYSISASGLYAQSDNVRLALQKNWGFSMLAFYEKDVTDKIELDVQDSRAVSSNSGQKNIATIFTGFPEYFSFLLKIVLSIMTILFISWLTLTLPLKKNIL